MYGHLYTSRLLVNMNVWTTGECESTILQINLSEYRSRARKPVEQRKESISSDSSPQATPTPSSSSFLPPTFTPSLLTSYTLHTPGANPAGTSLVVGVAGGVVSSMPPPQFEPVSPDDEEPASLHTASEGTQYALLSK